MAIKCLEEDQIFLSVNKSGDMISINALEYSAIIINYEASLTDLSMDECYGGPYHVLLNLVNNTSEV